MQKQLCIDDIFSVNYGFKYFVESLLVELFSISLFVPRTIVTEREREMSLEERKNSEGLEHLTKAEKYLGMTLI